MLSLNNDQVMQIWTKENSLPQGRFLAPSELSRLLGIQTGVKTEVEMHRMEELENEWNRILWKQRKIEDLGQERARTDQEELHGWDDYVLQNWDHSQDFKKEDY